MIIFFIGFKITFINIGFQSTPLLISRVRYKMLPLGFSLVPQTLGLKGLKELGQRSLNYLAFKFFIKHWVEIILDNLGFHLHVFSGDDKKPYKGV